MAGIRVCQLPISRVFGIRLLAGGLPSLPGQPTTDPYPGPGGLDETQPVFGWACVRQPRTQDLHHVAVAQPGVQRDQPAVDPRPDGPVPEFGVDGVGEVDRRGPRRQRDDPPLGSEDQYLVGVEVRRQRLQELTGILGVALPVEQAVQPGQALQPGAVRGRPDRPGDDPGLGEPVHRVRADLDVDGLAGRVHDGGVQRLVHVELGCGHEVAQPSRRRSPQGVHFPKRLITISDRIDEDQHADDVVVVPRLEAALLGPLVDREEMAGTGRDPGVDARLGQAAGELVDDRGKLAGLAFRGREGIDHRLDPRVLVGVQDGERPILQLPLDDVHAEPVRQRREDLQRHPGDARLLGWGLEAEGPHVVQPVGDLDEQDPVVPGQCDDQFPQCLGLGRVPETHLVELGHPVDEVGDLRAEVRRDGLQGVAGVLDRVVQEGRDDRGGVHPEFGEDVGDRQRMGDVRITAVPHLTGVLAVGDLVGADDESDVGLGMMLTVPVDDPP